MHVVHRRSPVAPTHMPHRVATFPSFAPHGQPAKHLIPLRKLGRWVSREWCVEAVEQLHGVKYCRRGCHTISSRGYIDASSFPQRHHSSAQPTANRDSRITPPPPSSKHNRHKPSVPSTQLALPSALHASVSIAQNHAPAYLPAHRISRWCIARNVAVAPNTCHTSV
ncbi:hypothetical protein BDU57DRAFT_321214 [Ampelomyces quisqualis]|uniref:Uncharacterized protein n=1 Tax=Ampelomyces quisqualis TaxID=50730 RepID=A0A6A5QGY1_AMPQU|nr:hypothetical protein BDU57DRAFT_321214 [Ampelomyces quisqualis]